MHFQKKLLPSASEQADLFLAAARKAIDGKVLAGHFGFKLGAAELSLIRHRLEGALQQRG